MLGCHGYNLACCSISWLAGSLAEQRVTVASLWAIRADLVAGWHQQPIVEEMSGMQWLCLCLAIFWQVLLLTHWQNSWLCRLVAWIYWLTKQDWLTGLVTIWPCTGSVSESNHHPTDRKQDPLITGSILHQQWVGKTTHSRHLHYSVPSILLLL